MNESVNASVTGDGESLYEFVVTELRNRGKLSLREVSEGSGVPERTIEKIATGATPDPLVSNCEKLAVYFRARKRRSDKALLRS